MTTIMSLARFNHGRWVAICPDSANAWDVTPGDATWPCGHCDVEHPIRWPDDTDAIERLCLARPVDINGNRPWSSWEWGETLTDLEDENRRSPWRLHPLYDPATGVVIG